MMPPPLLPPSPPLPILRRSSSIQVDVIRRHNQVAGSNIPTVEIVHTLLEDGIKFRVLSSYPD